MAAGSSAPELFTSVIGKHLRTQRAFGKQFPTHLSMDLHMPYVSHPVFSVQVYLSPKEMWEWAQSWVLLSSISSASSECVGSLLHRCLLLCTLTHNPKYVWGNVLN